MLDVFISNPVYALNKGSEPFNTLAQEHSLPPINSLGYTVRIININYAKTSHLP